MDEIKLTPILDTLKLENIDDAVYFSARYSDYISNSRLGLINPDQGGSWEKYHAGFAGNKIFSDSLIFGSAIHETMLQPESFFLAELVERPTAKLGYMADYIFDKCNGEITDENIHKAAIEVDYYHGIVNANQIEKIKNGITSYIEERKRFEEINIDTRIPIYLDSKSRAKYDSCIKALKGNKKIMDLLKPKGVLENPISLNEQTILLDINVEVNGYDPFILHLKSKLDNYTIDQESNTITVNDIKTTGKRVNLFNEAINTYHYRRELGMYAWLLSLCAQKYYNMENPTVKGNFLVVSTIPQYYTKVVPMTGKMFMDGFNEFKYLLKLVAKNSAEFIKANEMSL